jgi:ubiquinone/menaquinone biosynthesis C-methylase UbiE
MMIGEFSRYEESLHTDRYRYAQRFVEGKAVLDIACGTGYGCGMLRSAGASTVLGVDISSEAIEYASRHHADAGTVFELGNAEDLPGVQSESIDVITSFETIEHLADVERYLAEMWRVLRPGGEYLVSTPDRRLVSSLYPIRKKPNNPFHLREYTRDEFVSVVEERFRVVECLGQNFIPNALAFWPVQVALKAACHGFRSLGAYRYIDEIYHHEASTSVESPQEHRGRLATYWLLRGVRE